ncbi:putative sporulation protein YtxC [Paenibacillus sp. 481]|uniref:putative sporulation protein YtxC n=1 Tax=Paenibacillus sp. 481 TaxID=2835869 RepID=UPI001E491A11|nr:putative sporulation protein YtxC [Paenibacillus sp. 481]UHA72343.1 putative sporulation protein YtxC [Paenibacillus sp. 481]
MELFTVSIPQAKQDDVLCLFELLQQELGDLHTETESVTLEHSCSDQLAWITCRGVLPHFHLEQQGHEVWNRTARALAEFILAYKEQPLIRTLIARESKYDAADRVKVERYCIQLLNGTDDTGGKESRVRRKSKLARLLRTYLEEHTAINIDGYIRFRLDSYMSELKEVVEYAIDEFVLERQYQEFIGLLKYFVFIQDTKIPLAHLMHKGGHEFSLLNEQLQPLEPTHVVDGMVVEMIDCDMEMEDMIVSTLINVSPQNIIIHTREPESQVIKTIQQIFESRVQVCVYCISCQPFLSDEIQPEAYP